MQMICVSGLQTCRRFVLFAFALLAICSAARAATVGDVAWKSIADKPDHLRLEAQIYLEKGDKHVQVYLRRIAIEGGQTREMTIQNVASKKQKPFLEHVCSGRLFEVKEASIAAVGFDISTADLTGEGLHRREEAALLLELESRGKVVLSIQVDRPMENVFANQAALKLASVGPSLSREELRAFEVELDSRLRTDPSDLSRRTSRARISVSFDSKIRRRALGETVIESVCFVTNRGRSAEPSKNKHWADSFTGETSDTITYGRVDVVIPAQIITGRIKNNTTIPVDPLEVIPRLERTDLNQVALHELLEGAGEDDVIVYVHGYNNTFEEALQRAATRAQLGFDGSVIAFSWPSLGETFVTRSIEAVQKKPSLMDRMVSPLSKPYLRDWQVAADSQPALAKLLKQLLERRRESNGTARIHLLAHSMGNRVALAHSINSSSTAPSAISPRALKTSYSLRPTFRSTTSNAGAIPRAAPAAASRITTRPKTFH